MIFPKKKLFFRLVNAHGLLTDSLHRVILVTFILPLRVLTPFQTLKNKSLKDM